MCRGYSKASKSDFMHVVVGASHCRNNIIHDMRSRRSWRHIVWLALSYTHNNNIILHVVLIKSDSLMSASIQQMIIIATRGHEFKSRIIYSQSTHINRLTPVIEITKFIFYLQ